MPSTTIQNLSTTISSAQLKTLVETPITLVPAPGAGMFIQVILVVFDYVAGVPYTISGSEKPGIFTDGNSWGTPLQTTGFLDQSVNTILMSPAGFVSAGVGPVNFPSSEIVNMPVALGNTGTDLSGGTGFVVVTITYQITPVQ